MTHIPPLPLPDTHCFDEDAKRDVWSHSPSQVQAYGAAVAAAVEPRWVSVEELLPPKNQEVLIFFKGSSLPSTGQYTGNTRDSEDGWCYPSENSGDDTDWTVTHWMPLPQPPKG